MVDHHVQALGLKGGEDAVPFGRLQLGLDPQLLGQGFGELHLEAGQLAAFIDEAEGWVGAFEAYADHPFVFDGLQLLAGNGLAKQAGAQQQGNTCIENLFTDYCHDEAPMLLCSG
ncbi:hypothetical protein D3C77_320870 [compost metagenome]